MRGTINVSNTFNVGSSSDDGSHFDVILHNVNMKNKDPEIAFSKFSFSDDVTTSKKETDITEVQRFGAPLTEVRIGMTDSTFFYLSRG